MGKVDPKMLKLCMKAQAAINALPNIGSDRVFDNSALAAAQVLTAIAGKDSRTATAILLAEMQSGKTSAMIIIIWVSTHIFAAQRGLPFDSIKVGVLLLTNKSLTGIYDQTMKRLLASGFVWCSLNDYDEDQVLRLQDRTFGSPIVEMVMLSTGAYNYGGENGRLKAAKDRLVKAGCNCFLMLLDETHLAIQEGQQLDGFIKQVLNINLITKPTAHFDPPMLFVGVTATAHQKLVFPTCNYPVEIVYCPPGIGHVGRSALDHRIIDVRGIPEVDELVQVVKPYFKGAKGKVFVFRVKTSKRLNEEAIVREAALRLGIPEEGIKCFNSNNGNLSTVDAYISKPDRTLNTVVILKMGLGAGVTIESVKNVGLWWDTGFQDIESMAQSIGRNMGYNGGRDTATYPIFINRSKWDEYNRRMDDAKSGILSDSPETQRQLNSNKQVRRWITDGRPNIVLGSRTAYMRLAKKLNYQPEDMAQSHIRDNVQFNQAGAVIGEVNLRVVATRPIIPGKPINKEFLPSWKKLCAAYPEVLDPNNKKIFFVKNVTHLEVGPKNKYKNNIIVRV